MIFKFSEREDRISQNKIIQSDFAVFSWKEVKNNPFALFNSEELISEIFFDSENIDYKMEWAYEYELIYNSQLMEV